MPWIEYLGRYLHDPRFTRFMRTVKGLCVSPEAGYAALFAGAYFSREDELRMLQPGFKEETESYSAEAWIEAFLGKNEKMIVNDPMRVPLVFDRSSYLIDDLNVKMDRATMAHGLEARAPFLDQELVRFASSLPSEWLIRKKVGKYLLKDTLKEYLPPDVLGRKKRGFQVPLAAWFRGELRATFEERCLSESPHLTLYFWPEVLKIEWEPIRVKAAEIAGRTQPFTLKTTGIETFGPFDRLRASERGKDHVLYLGVAFSPELATIKKLCPWPNPRTPTGDAQEFHPHITLARVRHPERFAIVKKKILKQLADAAFDIRVDRLRLYAEVDGVKQALIEEFAFTGA
jgi:2'-5' RNA ligase